MAKARAGRKGTVFRKVPERIPRCCLPFLHVTLVPYASRKQKRLGGAVDVSPTSFAHYEYMRFSRRAFHAALVAAMVLPRIIVPDAYTLGDEPRWVIRSETAFRALRDRDWSNTGSLGYPGVTFMMTIIPVIEFYRLTHGIEDIPLETWTEAAQHEVQVWCRIAVGISTGLLGLCLYQCLRRLAFTRRRIVAASIALTAVHEPWLLGLSRTTLLDAHLSLLVLLALVAAAAAREQKNLRFVVGSGIALALAFLTKSYAVFFTPFIFLSFFHDSFQMVFRRAALWIAAFFGTALLLWPALWVHPFQRFGELLFWSKYHAAEFREPLYWPGVHPPFVILALSLPLFIGLCAYIGLRIVDLLKRRPLGTLFFADLVLLAGLAFQVAMQIVESDNSRWILPAIVLLSFTGAVGLFRLFTLYFRTQVAAALALGAQAIILFMWFPHMNLYMNPLFRTTEAAWQVGMGEGFPELAAYMESQEGSPVLITNTPGLLRPYLTSSSTIRLIRFPRSGKPSDFPPEATHVATLVSQNRALFDHGAVRVYQWMQERTPEHIIRLHGVPLIAIYRLD